MEETFNPFSLQGKTILVTGASSGIGKGIALACAKMGASILVCGRNEEKIDEAIQSMPGNHAKVIMDLTDFNAIADVVSKFPSLDGIVHCAGINKRTIAKQLTIQDIDSIMDINFKAPVFLQSEIIRQKKITKGASIIFVASLGSESPSIGNGVYSASKGALISYSKCLMLELAPRKIRVNCISPGMVWTDLIKDNSITNEDLRDDEARYPLKRYGQPQDIANLAIYLLSDASVWMTGSNVKISGGAR